MDKCLLVSIEGLIFYPNLKVFYLIRSATKKSSSGSDRSLSGEAAKLDTGPPGDSPTFRWGGRAGRGWRKGS